jgi:GT2 family glycosyltransferase
MSKVSVVISAFSENRLEYLLDCIDSLMKQSIKPHEIIVALDPKPKLKEFFRKSLANNVKIVVGNDYGLSNARNAGIRSAKGEIVAFIDDDAIAEEYWVERHVDNYEDPNVVGVGGFIVPMWENGDAKWFPEELNWIIGCSYKGLPKHKTKVRNPIGCNMSFRKDVFEKVGYFRSDVGRFGERLLAGEEPELSMRIRDKISTGKIVYNPSAVVYHRVDKCKVNLKYLCKRSFFEGISKALITSFRKGSSLSLSSEKSYLRHMIKYAIPLRLRSIYNFNNVCQLLVLFFSTAAVLMGFVSGKLVNVGK